MGETDTYCSLSRSSYGSYPVDNDPDYFASSLKCSVCFDYFSEPRCLPCGHTFCKKCVEEIIGHLKLWRKKPVKFSCPHCRHPVQEKQFYKNSPRNVVLESTVEGWLKSRERRKARTKMVTGCTQTQTDTSDVTCQTSDCEDEPSTQTVRAQPSPWSKQRRKLTPSNFNPAVFGSLVKTNAKQGDGRRDTKTAPGDQKLEEKKQIDRDEKKVPLHPTQVINCDVENQKNLSNSSTQTDKPEENETNLKACEVVHTGVQTDGKIRSTSGNLTAPLPENNAGDHANNHILSTLHHIKPALDCHFNRVGDEMAEESSAQSLHVLYRLNDHILPGERIRMGPFEMMGLTNKSPDKSNLSEILQQLFK